MEPVAPRAGLAFTDGAPDPKLVPDKALARAFRRALLSPAFRAGADYGGARGTSSLREALAGYLATDRGVVADPAPCAKMVDGPHAGHRTTDRAGRERRRRTGARRWTSGEGDP